MVHRTCTRVYKTQYKGGLKRNLTLISKDLLPKSKLWWMLFIKHYKSEFSVFFFVRFFLFFPHYMNSAAVLKQVCTRASPHALPHHYALATSTCRQVLLSQHYQHGMCQQGKLANKLSLHSHRISWKFSLFLSTSLKHVCGKYLFQFELKDAWRTCTVHIMFILGGYVNELRCFACLNFLLATLGHWSFSSPLEGKFEHNCGKVMTLSWCELGAFMSSVQLKNKTKQKTHIPSLFTATDHGFVASVLAWLAHSSHTTRRM